MKSIINQSLDLYCDDVETPLWQSYVFRINRIWVRRPSFWSLLLPPSIGRPEFYILGFRRLYEEIRPSVHTTTNLKVIMTHAQIGEMARTIVDHLTPSQSGDWYWSEEDLEDLRDTLEHPIQLMKNPLYKNLAAEEEDALFLELTPPCRLCPVVRALLRRQAV